MQSLRFRLFALWVMLVVSGASTAFLLYQSYRQSANARLARSEELVARACRDIGDRYQFYVSGWNGAPVDDRLKQELAGVVQTALAPAVGVEGGIWQQEEGSLAYAFPSYEGTGPKTDLPAAELATIREVNAEAARSGRPAAVHQQGRSQVLLVHACPLRGPLANVTGWTMTRVFTAQGPAYSQLVMGLAVLAATILGAAVWLAWVLYAWSRRIASLETVLAAREQHAVDLPALPRTGEQELDRLVDALNTAGDALARERARATASERLAAVGRLSAGLAHEIRNPIAAMRLRAENALAAGDEARKRGALEAILRQIARLDALLRDLLDMTQNRVPALADVELSAFLHSVIEPHLELAAAKSVTLAAGSSTAPRLRARFDAPQMQRALDNLILNAVQNTPRGGTIVVRALRRDASLVLQVEDDGPGVPDDLRDRLFEPFVTARPEGTGLGLALTREIARAHGGQARLATSPRGALFEIEVPWQPS
jgi:signal transduction histidine kinase